MKMSEYQALVAYFGVTLVVFVGGLLWYKYRRHLKRRFPLVHYHEKNEEVEKPLETDSRKASHTHA